MAERILSNDEIAEMEKLTVDRLVEAIDRDDREGAKKLARRMYNEFLSMHDLYRNWTSATLSFVGRRFGDKALEEAMDEGVKAWWGPSLDKMPQDVRARVKMFAAGLRGHLQPLQILAVVGRHRHLVHHHHLDRHRLVGLHRHRRP